MRNAYPFFEKEVVEITKVTTKASFLCIFYVLDLDLTMLHLLSHLIFTTNSKGRYFYGFLFVSEKSEAQIA